jgi:NAD(P)-dependent dehydrogenase (short-subunit alcohol dehydrogenase family)
MEKTVEYDFSDRVALVTGAAKGIGRSVATLLASFGAKVAIVDVDEQVSAVEAEINDRGGEAIALRANLRLKQDVDDAVRGVVERYGRIDFLVNNAGVFRFGFFSQLTEEQWDDVVGNNLKGCFLVTRAVLPHMREGGRGSIVNLSSLFAFDNVAGYSAYNVSKAGINALTVTLSREEARNNIRVNAVAPGAIDTPMNTQLKNDPQLLDTVTSLTPMRRLGAPEEVARAVVFLLSDDASYITGHVLWVTGGYRNPF